MATVVREVRQQVVDMALLRSRMEAAGVSLRELAEVAGVCRPNMSAILAGRQYLGPERTAKLIRAIEALGLDQDDGEQAS